MADERLRVSVDDAYTHALGLACFTFARLEWDVYWCCEKIQPGKISALFNSPRFTTATTVAEALVTLAKTLPTSVYKATLELAASEYASIVKSTRNPLIHGKPGTDSCGAQRLFRRDGSPWSIQDVNRASDEFTALQIRLNDLIHSFP